MTYGPEINVSPMISEFFFKAKFQVLVIKDCDVQMAVMIGTAYAAYCPLTFVICINYPCNCIGMQPLKLDP